MSKIKKILSFVIAGLYVVSMGRYAVNIAAQKGRGGRPGAFMSWGAGARSLGMGKAFVALSDDASATYWNPAGLAGLSRSELTALHTILWGGTVYDFISYVHPTDFGGTLGFSGTRLFLGGFEGRDEYNRVTHTFADIQSAYGVSYGQKIMETLSIGANMKKMSHTLDDHVSGSYIVDMGTLYSPMENLRLGLNLQNLLAISHGTADKIPIVTRFGMNYKLLREKLSIGADMEASIGWAGGMPFHLGAEYWAMSYLAMRMGIDPQEFNIGFGLRYEDYGLDYAYATHELGGSHRISATVSFGTSVEKIRQKTSREYEIEGDAAYKNGIYNEAVRSFEKAYSLNTTDRVLSRKLNLLSKIMKVSPQIIGNTDRARLLRRGIKEYIEREDYKVLLLALNHIIAENPTDHKAKKLLLLIGTIENIEQPRIRVAEGMTLTEYKLHRALQFFYEGKYAKAIEECQDVLMVDPNNANAHKRVGSAFYAIGNEEKALKAWRKSLKLNPSDKTLHEFINRIQRDAEKEPEEESEEKYEIEEEGLPGEETEIKEEGKIEEE
ncbi:PorV/PorQ family protein [Elusimicrobiota bacterium]